MIVRFTPDAEETLRACAALSTRHLPRERGEVILLATCALGFLSAYLIVPSHWIVVGTLSYLLTIVAFAAVRLDHRRRIARMLRDNPHLGETHEIEVASHRLMSRCSHQSTEYAWSAVEQVTEDAEFYVFSTGAASGLTVPKRALSDVEAQLLREIVCSSAPDRGMNLARMVGEAPAVP